MTNTFKSLAVIFSYLGFVKSQQCYVNGEVFGTFNNVHSSSSYNECLNYCQKESSCTCFTYYEDTKECVEFSNCFSLDETCSTCLSGEKECTQVSLCNVNGKCIGEQIGTITVDKETECLSQCKSTPTCEYYTYRTDNSSCELLKGCSVIEPCPNCHSGQKDCYPWNQGM